MNKRQDMMEKALALVLLVYAIALLVGERFRDALFGGAAEAGQAGGQGQPWASRRDKWRRYSGVLV